MEQKFNATKYKNDFQKENYDRIIVNVDKGKKEIIKQYAKSKGLSLNSYIVNLVNKDMNQNQQAPVQSE